MADQQAGPSPRPAPKPPGRRRRRRRRRWRWRWTCWGAGVAAPATPAALDQARTPCVGAGRPFRERAASNVAVHPVPAAAGGATGTPPGAPLLPLQAPQRHRPPAVRMPVFVPVCGGAVVWAALLWSGGRPRVFAAPRPPSPPPRQPPPPHPWEPCVGERSKRCLCSQFASRAIPHGELCLDAPMLTLLSPVRGLGSPLPCLRTHTPTPWCWLADVKA